MRCISYHRVSTNDQDPQLAREELRSAAARLGMELVEEIEETGSGARNAASRFAALCLRIRPDDDSQLIALYSQLSVETA